LRVVFSIFQQILGEKSMVEQFSSFVQEALEFLSLLRASVKKNNDLIHSSIGDIKKSIDTQIKRIEEKIGTDKLTHAIKALELSVDLLQRGSTMLDYKFTMQKTRELLDDIKGANSQYKTPASSRKSPLTSNTTQVAEKHTASSSSPTHTKPSPSKTHLKTKAPASSKPKSVKPPVVKASDKEEVPTPKPYSSVDSMMGTRTKAPRRAVRLKKTPSTKVITSNGEPIEIEIGSDEDDE
jgi:hypothetical protein